MQAPLSYQQCTMHAFVWFVALRVTFVKSSALMFPTQYVSVTIPAATEHRVRQKRKRAWPC